MAEQPLPEVPPDDPNAGAGESIPDDIATHDRHGRPLSDAQRLSIARMREGRRRAVAEGTLGQGAKTKAKRKRTNAPRQPSKRAAAREAAEGTADLVTQVGMLVTPLTPLGGAYLMASSAEAEAVAAHLAEVDPRVMAALVKARRVTAWSGVVSLGVGFVGAVMLERGMLPDVIGEVPIGPANVQLAEMHRRLREQGVYDRWAERDWREGVEGVEPSDEDRTEDRAAAFVVD